MHKITCNNLIGESDGKVVHFRKMNNLTLRKEKLMKLKNLLFVSEGQVKCHTVKLKKIQSENKNIVYKI